MDVVAAELARAPRLDRRRRHGRGRGRARRGPPPRPRPARLPARPRRAAGPGRHLRQGRRRHVVRPGLLHPAARPLRRRPTSWGSPAAAATSSSTRDGSGSRSRGRIPAARRAPIAGRCSTSSSRSSPSWAGTASTRSWPSCAGTAPPGSRSSASATTARSASARAGCAPAAPSAGRRGTWATARAYLLLRAVYRARENAASLAMVWGYAAAAVTGAPQCPHPPVTGRIRESQRLRRGRAAADGRSQPLRRRSSDGARALDQRGRSRSGSRPAVDAQPEVHALGADAAQHDLALEPAPARATSCLAADSRGMRPGRARGACASRAARSRTDELRAERSAQRRARHAAWREPSQPAGAAGPPGDEPAPGDSCPGARCPAAARSCRPRRCCSRPRRARTRWSRPSSRPSGRTPARSRCSYNSGWASCRPRRCRSRRCSRRPTSGCGR